MKKRILCIVLAAVMLAAVLPLSASAYGHIATNPMPDGLYKKWKQTDERWKDLVIGKDPWTGSDGVWHEEETMGHAGCMLTSMAIATRGYGLTLADGTEITPLTLGTAMYDGGSCKYLNGRGAAIYQSAFDEVIPGLHFCDYEVPANPAARIAQLLSNPEKEYLILAGVNGGGHYLAVDYVSEGNVYVCDPGFDRTMLSEYPFFCLLVYLVDEEYVDPGAIPAPSPIWEVIEAAGVNLRENPGTGADNPPVGAYAYGTQFEVLETTEADGYLWARTADGWCALRMLDGDEVYCTPVYSAAEYAVTYHTNGGTGGPEAQTKLPGTVLKLSTVVPTKKGYRFLGWSPDPSAISADYAPGSEYWTDAPLALYAVWMPERDIYAFGIDVSAYQGDVDWKAVAGDGIRFVILRAGTSNGKDERFEENYRGAKAAGLHVGSYFFSYALTNEEAEQDAAMFREWLEGKTFDMPVYLDLETEEQKQLPSEQLVQMALHFQAAMEDTGLLCGVYSSASWYDTRLNGYRLGGREYLWVAKWTESGTLSQNMSDRFGMYQYSENGRVAGIEGDVDLDVCYIDYPSLLAEPWPGSEGDAKPLPGSGLQVREGVIVGGMPELTVEEWSGLFSGPITFRRASGARMGEEEIVGTGCVADCGSRSYLVSVRGDVTGDGLVDAMDYMLVKRHVLGTYLLDDASYYAACLTSQNVESTDYALLKRYVLGTYNLYGEAMA